MTFLKVRIIKSERETYWYSSLVGEIVLVSVDFPKSHTYLCKKKHLKPIQIAKIKAKYESYKSFSEGDINKTDCVVLDCFSEKPSLQIVIDELQKEIDS